jgi:hypothetical protein
MVFFLTCNYMNTTEVRVIMSGITAITLDVDHSKARWEQASGQVKEAYKTVYQDNLWRLRKKIEQLWFYALEQPVVPTVEFKWETLMGEIPVIKAAK